MSQTAKNYDQPSIDAILKGLSSRPNVQATLILSRKDGSIIRATGVAGPDEKSRSANQRFNGIPPNGSATVSQESSIETSQQGEVEKAPESETFSAAQKLAVSIYQFVKTSSNLAASMAESTVSGTGSAGNVTYGPTQEYQEPNSRSATGMEEDDAQLLRMRTKRQEIIIFPDPNYLCCVVQNLANKDNRQQ